MLVLGEVGPELGEVGDRGGAEQADRDAAEQRERADRDGEGRQPDHGDEEPVDRAATAPTRIAMTAATGSSPAWVRMPITLDRPTMLATERSISPVMMISVIGRAMSRIGATSRSR